MVASTVKKRFLTAVILIILISVITYFISWSSFPPNGIRGFVTASYAIVFSIASIAYMLIAFEVVTVVFKNKSKKIKTLLWILLCLYGLYIIWRYFSIENGFPTSDFIGGSRFVVLGLSTEQLLVTVVVLSIVLLFSFRLGLKNILAMAALIIIGALVMKNIAWISTRIGYETIFWIFLISIFTDTFAYFIGSKFGKHKVFESISPKKTWEGALGGFVFGTTVAVVVGTIFSIFHSGGTQGSLSANSIFQLGPSYFWAYLLLGIVLSSFTQIGDLFFSVFKRNYGVKDYSNIFPGHGGILDRIDGTIFSILVFSLIYVIFVFPPFL